MQDGIIKGTGNSRFLKSVPDFLSQYPTYESFVAALAAGTLPVDFNGINETGWQQLGTALNKGNLLSDETAAMLGALAEVRHISLSSVKEGDIIELPVNGKLVQFFVKPEYEPELNGPGRVLFVPRIPWKKSVWNAALPDGNDSPNTYSGSTIDTDLETNYKALLPGEIQAALGTVIPYTPGNGNYELSSIRRDIFLLSLTEFGVSYSGVNVEGAPIGFASKLGLSTTSAEEWWSRSPRKYEGSNSSVAYSRRNGNQLYGSNGSTKGERLILPAFTLPKTFEMDIFVDSTTQEVLPAQQKRGTPDLAFALLAQRVPKKLLDFDVPNYALSQSFAVDFGGVIDWSKYDWVTITIQWTGTGRLAMSLGFQDDSGVVPGSPDTPFEDYPGQVSILAFEVNKNPELAPYGLAVCHSGVVQLGSGPAHKYKYKFLRRAIFHATAGQSFMPTSLKIIVRGWNL